MPPAMRAIMRWAVLLVALTPPAHALRRGPDGSTADLRGPYLMHEGCPHPPGGIGCRLSAYSKVVRAVLDLDMTFVCQPSNWGCGGHGYNQCGGMIGCTETAALGEMVPLGAVAHLKRIPTTVEELRNHSAEELRSLRGVVYYLPEMQYCLGTSATPFGGAWPWFRSQFREARLRDPRRRTARCWGEPGAAATKIAVTIRRGDDPHRGYPMATYTALLDLLFAGKIEGVQAKAASSHIAVLSEVPADDPEARAFDKYRRLGGRVSYHLGAACQGITLIDSCWARLEDDLDCMATSDILLISHGDFSALAVAVQDGGVSLVFRQDAIPAPNAHVLKQKPRVERSRDIPNEIDVFVGSEGGGVYDWALPSEEA